jgi:hypothetical protein
MGKTLDRLVFERAIELVRAGWTHGASARNIKGNRVEVDSKHAVRFSGYGALERAASELIADWTDLGAYYVHLSEIAMHMPGFHDLRSKRQVLARLREKLAQL